MPTITSIKGRLLFNSRGHKTIEIDVETDGRYIGRSSSPSGASVGKHEAQSFHTDGPEKSLSILKENNRKFIGIDAADLKSVYNALRSIDNSDNYRNIGGSVAYALSIAAIESASKAYGEPMFKILKNDGDYRFPYPLGNILGGGAHAGPGTPDIQEILCCPIGSKDIFNSIEMNIALHKEVKNILLNLDNRFTYGRGDEGAWAPNLTNDKALDVVEKAISNCGYILGKEMAMGIDFASSSFWDENQNVYDYKREGKKRTTDEQIDYVNNLISKYKLIYVEDPVHEEDFDSMHKIKSKNNSCLITGDDMLVTNKERVKESLKVDSCNGAILKVNQAGSLYDAMLFADACSASGIDIITSHRSGESIDSHISHISIATDSLMIKTGIIGGERISKLNELIRLTEYDLIKGMIQMNYG